MNKSFDNGSRIVTSYRNSKNFGSSWISSGYALWFLREGKYLSQARSVLGNSCAISGTGFLVRTDILVRDGGWSHHLLTEDIEFSIDSICKGDRIDYAPNAIVYDEQPITFAQSWNQRLRWSRGFYQVFLNYGGRLLRGIRNRDFSSYDMMMTIAPGMLITIASLIANTTFFIISICDTSLTSQITEASVQAMFFSVFNFYLCLFCFGLLTSITERKQIHATRWQRIRAVVTFPVFMLTYAPIAVVALFKKVEWKPIAHTVSVTAQEITGQAAEPRRLER